MSNKWKNIVDVKIGEDTYHLYPSFEAMEIFVGESKMSEVQAIGYLYQNSIPSSVLVTIIWAGIVGYGKATDNAKLSNISRKVIGQRMMDHGLPAFEGAALKFLMGSRVDAETYQNYLDGKFHDKKDEGGEGDDSEGKDEASQ